jgi:hypothetical protein
MEVPYFFEILDKVSPDATICFCAWDKSSFEMFVVFIPASA